ncbi:MAG: glycosyltransferase family 39 protein, partial [Anaerolineae bacterium]|nr:glycosyltransferase family 39 protein [Anaerolineae bacterium]
ITVEMTLWALIAVVALALRLIHLDAAPLNASEAREAMLAWRVGQSFQTANYSPLLLAANTLLFTLCGASDTLARLWPALFGSVLALMPFLLRRRIGRVGALAAGLYLALSPTALLASRQLDGAVVAAVGAMALLGGLVSFRDTSERRWLILAAAGLALALTSSPVAYGLLLPLALACLTLSLIWPNEKVTLPHLHSPFFILPSPFFLLPSSFFILAFSTGLGWNPAGLGAAGDLLPAWIARFGPVSTPVVSPFTLLAVYEPLALLFGLGGLVWAIRQPTNQPTNKQTNKQTNQFGALLGLWAALATLLLILMPGRAPLDLLWVLLPLTLLTGITVQALVQARGSWFNEGHVLSAAEGLYVLLVLILWAHCYLVLVRYAETGNVADAGLVLLTVVLQMLLALVFALAVSLNTALRGVVVGTGIALLAVTLSAGWNLAHARPSDPRELLVRRPTAVEVRDLVQTLRDLSWRETGMPTTLPFTLEAAPDSVLAWYLRDFSAARRVERLSDFPPRIGGDRGGALVTWHRGDEPDHPAPTLPDGIEYVGQGFALRRSWDAREITCVWEWPPRCQAAVGHLLLRRTPSAPVTDEWAAFWLPAMEE